MSLEAEVFMLCKSQQGFDKTQKETQLIKQSIGGNYLFFLYF